MNNVRQSSSGKEVDATSTPKTAASTPREGENEPLVYNSESEDLELGVSDEEEDSDEFDE